MRDLFAGFGEIEPFERRAFGIVALHTGFFIGLHQAQGFAFNRAGVDVFHDLHGFVFRAGAVADFAARAFTGFETRR